MKPIATVACACLALCLAAVTPARAQSVPESPKLDPKACADRERLTLGDTHELQGRDKGRKRPGRPIPATSSPALMA